MIKSWSLRHFKSVYEEPPLELALLTVFAGANSSGKSTVIQSLLLTAQTLQSPVVSRPIVLNGHIVRLGTFDDVLSDEGTTDKIEIGFELAVSEDSVGTLLRSVRSNLRVSHRFIERLGSVRCSYSFSARGDGDEREIMQLQPRIETCSVEVTPNLPDLSSVEVVLNRSNIKPAERLQRFGIQEASTDTPNLEALKYEVKKPLKMSNAPRYAVREVLGATLMHFLPGRICVGFDPVEQQYRQLLGLLSSAYYYRGNEFDSDEPIYFNDKVKQIVLDTFQKFVLDQNLANTPKRRFEAASEALRENFTSEGISACYAHLSETHKQHLGQAVTARATEIEHAFREGRTAGFATALVSLPMMADLGVNYIQQFFSQRVKYLGPLRDEPKPVYPLATATDPGDIGFKGENTAAVFEIYKNSKVSYISSHNFAERTSDRVPHTATLADAVLDWLNYMGVVSDLQSEDKGKLGHELKVAAFGSDNLHDLTHVGVGVSQVLPILVLCLLAEPGSTLIFEQPELHLHPRVQTRLADFFISMTMLKNQCVVETHSEYLINRLRHQVAISEGTKVAESIIIYFVEKHQGRSKYRPIRINEFGVIPDWPKGFFDESEEIAAELLHAGMLKRRTGAVRRNV